MAEETETLHLNFFSISKVKKMAYMLDKWERFKEIVGADKALTELEKALGTWLLTDHVKFILRMNDYENLIKVSVGGDDE
jgi:hypothetical protein